LEVKKKKHDKRKVVLFDAQLELLELLKKQNSGFKFSKNIKKFFSNNVSVHDPEDLANFYRVLLLWGREWKHPEESIALMFRLFIRHICPIIISGKMKEKQIDEILTKISIVLAKKYKK